MSTGLYICVEGADDTRFVNKILNPLLVPKCYAWLAPYEYAQKKPSIVQDFIASINKMPHADYLFLADMDEYEPCITSKKNSIQLNYPNIDLSKVIIVKLEIEGWYIAGLTTTAQTFFHIQTYPDTNTLTKEQFNRLKPRSFASRIDFMQEILKPEYYDFQLAKKQNISFNYFLNKYLCT